MDEKKALRAVAAMKRERPEWLRVLEAALVVAERSEPYGGEFAGAWVLDELEKQSGQRVWLPNLRVLMTYGFLEKAGESTRGGRRAYYRLIDRRTLGRVVAQLKASEEQAPETAGLPKSRFSFVGAGDSGKPGSDTARRAGDIPYRPRSWR